VCNALNGIGNNYCALKHFDNALNYLKQALIIGQNICDKVGVGISLNNIATVYQAKGDNDAVLDYLQQSLVIARELNHKESEGAVLSNVGQSYLEKGDYAAAKKYMEQAMTLHIDIGNQAGHCFTLLNMGHIHWRNHQREEALGVWLKAYQLAKPMGLTQALDSLAELAENVGLSPGLAGWAKLSQERET
jgi:tetratricopeptide (TPR) repeat protein